MIDKLQHIATIYESLLAQQYDPAVTSDIKKSIEISKQINQLTDAYELYKDIKSATEQQNEARTILLNEKDIEVLEMAQIQFDEAQEKLLHLETQVQVVLLPKDPNDERNIFLEIRPGAGGDEAGLFGAELMRMYLRYAERQGWKPELIENDLNDVG